MKPALLVLTPEPLEGASSRLRAIDLIQFWREDMTVQHLAFLSRRSFQLKEQPGRLVAKSLSVLLDALWFLLRFPLALFRTDRVLVHRNVAPLGPPILEWWVKLCRKPLFYDFDDAIYLNPSTSRNRWLGPLKMNRRRTRQLVSMADGVIAGNEHLARYARQFQPRVIVVPTGLDLAAYRQARAVTSEASTDEPETLVIGWVGGPGTSGFVRRLMPVFERVLAKFPNAELHLIGGQFQSQHDRIRVIRWRLDTELAAMANFSIGINPLDDNEFTRGKCGFKVVQYQALGIPVVSSRVGVCAEQVSHGVDGFLAQTDAEWQTALETLLSDAAQRQAMADAARSKGDQYERRALARQMADLMLAQDPNSTP